MPVGREGAKRGAALERSEQSLVPSLFAVPPGLLTSAFMANPYAFIRRMSDEMNEIFEGGAFGTTPTRGADRSLRGRGGRSASARWIPQIEIRQRGNELVVRADLPGLKKEDVSIEVEDGVLTLAGERREEHEEEREGFFRSERSYGTFHRAIALPEGVNEDEISASFKDGVLEVRVPAPRERQQRARKVEIR